MKWKPYPEYKETTKPWLSEIPAHWDTKRIKHTTYVKGRIGWQGLRSEEFIDQGPFLVTGTDFIDGTINWQSCYHITEERYSEDPYIQLKNGDLLITKDGTIGKVAVVQELKEKATLNSGIFLTRQITNHCESRFMYWLLNSSVFMNFIDFNKSGSTISHLFQNVFIEFLYPIPSIEEQRTIAAFLDRETDHIDTLIAKKKLQIDLLLEKRSALISHVVTKGLNPNVKMKDSGVEWLGDIPEDWKPIRLKYLTRKIGSGKTPHGGNQIYSDSGIIFLRSQNIYDDGIRLEDVVYIDTEIDNEMNNTRVMPNDLLLNITGASIGRTCIVPSNFSQANVNQHVCIIRLQNKIEPRFIAYYLKSSGTKYQINSLQVGSSRQGLNFDEIGNLIIALPDKLENQGIIASFLDSETQKLDSLQSKIDLSITELQEYRIALISAAVTGKIDVRQEVS